MAKTNFKNFVLKKDATGSFESVKQKHGHDDCPKKPSVRDLFLEFMSEQRQHNKNVDATLKQHGEKLDRVIRLNNLKS